MSISVEKTIHDEEFEDAESMQDFKVCTTRFFFLCLDSAFCLCKQNKLEAQYAAKRDVHISEVADLKQQLEMRVNEMRALNGTIDSLKSVNEELKVRFEDWSEPN